jgi:TRAP-type C4-dicarboxylate transport system permease small subunit
MTAFQRIDAAIGRVYHWIGNIVGVTIALFAVAIALDLFMRLLKIGNLPGMQEIVAYALYFGVFLAAPWVLRLGAHVRVDVLVSALPKGVALILERTVDVVALGVCLLFLYYGLTGMVSDYVNDVAKRQTYVVYEWVLLLIFNLTFLMLAVEFVFRLIRSDAPEFAAAEAEKDGL